MLRLLLVRRMLICWMLSAGTVCWSQDPQIPNGFQPLFNGRNLQGWHGDDPHLSRKAGVAGRKAAIAAQQEEFLKHWRVDNGELVNDGQGPFATTDRSWGNIELLLEYRTVPLADSGIYLRGAPQVQIWDITEAGGKWNRGADKGSGGLFNNSPGTAGQQPLLVADRPFGEWNAVRILQLGSRTWVDLNQQRVVDGAIMENYWDRRRLRPLPARGPIHLQTHGGEIRWRNLAVRSVPVEEAIATLRGDDAQQGFTPIFNGRDLSGWTGAVDSYEVSDEAIVCRPGQGGVLYTQEQFDDFVVRLEFLTPPGGNNGLAIRYPGSGQPHIDGLCELQVLDDSHENYATLDPRQYHGSVYGMVPAYRGFLNPAGEWNYQEVTVIGSAVRVELNGTIILNADLSQVTEVKDHLPHPGRTLTRGAFGLAGHHDPVRFRRLAIRRLPRQ